MDIWNILSYYGDPRILVFVILIIFIYAYVKNKRKLLGFSKRLLIIVIIATLCAIGLKHAFKIPRPCEGEAWCPSSYSFPSTHATISFSFTIAILLYSPIMGFILLPMAMLTCISRLMLNLHTLPDVFAGALLGSSIAMLICRDVEV